MRQAITKDLFMTLTKYGLREWGAGGALLFLLIAYGVFLIAKGNCVAGWIILVLALLALIAVVGFFRSPTRKIVSDPLALSSPADGTVKDIEVVDDFTQEPFTGKALRIGIFLSVFNVHVNRAPADWKVLTKIYRKGRYYDARDSRCVRENEAMTLAGIGQAGGLSFPLAVRQISGAIARRIVCPPSSGSEFAKGDIYGMIKFGSRTELYVPVDDRFEVAAKIGDKVKAGETVLVRIKK